MVTGGWISVTSDGSIEPWPRFLCKVKLLKRLPKASRVASGHVGVARRPLWVAPRTGRRVFGCCVGGSQVFLETHSVDRSRA